MAQDPNATATELPAQEGLDAGAPQSVAFQTRPTSFKYTKLLSPRSGVRMKLRVGSHSTGSAATSVPEFLSRVIESRLLTPAELETVLAKHESFPDQDTPILIEYLRGQGLLTDYQIERLLGGQVFGLVLGNYRIVQPLGSGGMGVVYKAEHVHMKRAVAIKVLTMEEDRHSVYLHRFYSEMQATAVLSHPNIVLAFDAGEVAMPNSRGGLLCYLVMEFVPGWNLEQYVVERGPLPAGAACELIRQAALGLQHAFEHGLVHRDVKPSNFLLTPQGQVKILDFGLARLGGRRHTEAHIMLGSIDYMAPEQARDARSVDIRADIYGLGGCLYWLLSGQKPFPGDRPVLEELIARQRESPISLHHVRGDLAPELTNLVAQMMAADPEDRPPTPAAVVGALNAFLDKSGELGWQGQAVLTGRRRLASPADWSREMDELADGPRKIPRILSISSDEKYLNWCRQAVEQQGWRFLAIGDMPAAIEFLATEPVEILLIDDEFEQDSGLKLCSEIRSTSPQPAPTLLLLTAANTPERLEAAYRAGADDCLPKTASLQELIGRLQCHLRFKEAEVQAEVLADLLHSTRQQLEQAQRLRSADVLQAEEVLIFTMAKMAEIRGMETGSHLRRMQCYARLLAEEAGRLPAFADVIDDEYVRMLERCVLLHDIGKVAVPDHVLLKPGKLEPIERSVMESHTSAGADILAAVGHQHGAPLSFLPMAIDIARCHHERHDGTGYPDGLAGKTIPLAARIVTVADVYDALRSKLVYKPGIAHGPTKRLIINTQGQFDPDLVTAFQNCEAGFASIFDQVPG